MTAKPRQGYRLDFSPGAPGSLHEFCGDNNIPGASCPNCHKPLLRILSLSSNDSRLELDPDKALSIHLLYCWTCSIPYGTFAYRISRDNSVSMVTVPPAYEHAFGVEGPYDEYTGQFPYMQVGLTAISEQDQERIASMPDTELNHFDATRHQIGGNPFIHNEQTVTCPSCQTKPPFFAAVCDYTTEESIDSSDEHLTFTGNPGTQMIFHLCRGCSIVVAYHSND